MSWFDAIPPFLCAFAVFILPGVPVALTVGGRGITFLALSVGGSVSAIAASALIAPILGLDWNPYVPFIISLPLAIVGLFLRRWWLLRYPAHESEHEWGWTFAASLIGLAAGAVLIALPLKAGIGMPDWIAQTPDVSYHFNAVRQILDTGNASTMAMNLASPSSSLAFYPAAWHEVVAAVVQSSGAEIAVAANATTFAIACLVWPIGCVFLVRQLLGRDKLTLILAGILSAGFAAFPLLLTEYGVLYPYLLGVALMPIPLGLLVMACGKARLPDLEPPGRWLLLFWTMVGVGVAHPSAALAIVALSVPLIGQLLIEYLVGLRGRRHAKTRGMIAVVLFVAGLAVACFVWLRAGAGPGTNTTHPYQPLSQAFTEALTNAPLQQPAAVVVSILVIAGLVIALRKRHFLWLVASYLITVGFYMVVTGWPTGDLRSAVVGIWYNNSPRLAALLPLFAVPLATLGAAAAIRWLQLRVDRLALTSKLPPRRRYWPTMAVAVLLVAVSIPITQASAIAHAETLVAKTYQMSDNAALLSPDELAMFDYVKKNVPFGAVIADNPWDGSGLVYAYTDRKALFPHISGSWSAERWEIADHLADGGPAVCHAIKDFGVSYVLDFGDRYLTPGHPGTKEYPGLEDLDGSDMVTLVTQRGQAELYKVTGCHAG